MSIASIFGEEWDDYMGINFLMDFISTLAIAITQSKESSRIAVEMFPHDRLHRLNKITWKQTQLVLNFNSV